MFSISQVASKRSTLPLAISVGVIAASLYFSTLMLDIGSCEHGYCADVGEFQVALATWGTVHHTGYPLYMLLGSPFVTLLRWLGVPPSAGASAYSLLWETLAVIGLALIVMRLTHPGWLAWGASLLIAVLRPIWIHGSIPEVYSLSMVLSVAILWVTLDLYECWSDHRGWLLAFLGGLGAAHHRLIAILLIPVGLYLLASAWRSKNFWRWLALSVPLFLAGFLPYLDMPLRVWLGSTWNYGRPDTWDGFWFIFWGKEVAGLQKPNFNPAMLAAAIRDVFRLFRSELTLPGLCFGLAGSCAALVARRTRSVSMLLIGMILSYVLFATAFHGAVLIEADLMLPLAALVILSAAGLSLLPNRWTILAGLLLCGWSVLLTILNYPIIYQLTHDPISINYLQQVEKLEAPDEAVVMAPWGARFFALAYAQRVEGRMTQWNIVDHRANFKELAQATTGRIYMAFDTLYVFDADWWTAHLGAPLRITSVGPNLIALTAQPLETAPKHVLLIGDNLALVHWEVSPLNSEGQTDVILYWTAIGTPATDYSTYIHVTDLDEITSPDDLIAQNDSSAPVYGWYPTSRWQPNEVVREDHIVFLSPNRSMRTIFAGMYSRDAHGNFIQLGRIALRNVEGAWVAQP